MWQQVEIGVGVRAAIQKKHKMWRFMKNLKSWYATSGMPIGEHTK